MPSSTFHQRAGCRAEVPVELAAPTLGGEAEPEADSRLYGFSPLSGEAPRILILGSMPSVRSLALGRYYGHPRNRFWPVMAAICEEALPDDFDARYAMLVRHGAALWDMIGACERAGSLDSAIRRIVPNDVAGYLRSHPSVRAVFLNGSTSASVWRRAGVPALQAAGFPIERLFVQQLPSTSPANAKERLPDLIASWSAAISPWLRDPQESEY